MPISTFDRDAAAICHGLDAVTVTTPTGDLLVGMWDEYEQQLPYEHDLPRFATELGTFRVLTIATFELRAAFGLAEGAYLTPIRGQTITKDSAPYDVREFLRQDDGRITELYLVAQ